MSYRNSANENARETVRKYRDEILEQLHDTGKASDDLLNDYSHGDSYHHERHINRRYSPIDAAELIVELRDYAETDSGLWEGQRPKEAIGTCAAYTYGKAVYSFWTDLIKEINDEAATIINEYKKDGGGEGNTVAELIEKETAALNALLDRPWL